MGDQAADERRKKEADCKQEKPLIDKKNHCLESKRPLIDDENHCLKDEEYKKALFQRIEAIQLLDMIDFVKGKGKEKYVLKKIIEQ